MMRIMLATEPDRFDVLVRQPGLRLIAEKVGEKPLPRRPGRPFQKIADSRDAIPPEEFKDYWREVIPHMMTAYKQICAYSCFRIHRVTGAPSVDHMAPKSRRWDQVYEWSNYRLASSRMNARKNNFEDILDPFEIQDGWFQLEDFGYGIRANPNATQQLIDRIHKTISRLKLDDEYHREQREEDANQYLDGHWSYIELIRQSPFVASELRRQGRLLSKDQ